MNLSGDPAPQRVAIGAREDLFLLRGFLSPAECRGFIALSEDQGFEAATIATARGQMRDIRDNDRLIWDDPALADDWWQRVQPFLTTAVGRWRRTLTTHGDGQITQASYDAAGRRTSLSEGSNSWSWQYDARDRVTQLTQPAGWFAGCARESAIDAMASKANTPERCAAGAARAGAVSYQYDLVGNRTRTTSANQVVSYGFHALNRLRTVRSGTPANPPTASTPAHEYEYAQLPAVASLRSGLRTAEVRPNGTRTEYAHNVRNHITNPRYARLAALVHKAVAGALLLGLSYGVGATGLRNSITETVDGGVLSRVTAYDYDDNKRLIREEIARAGQTGTQVTSWVYDRLPAVTSLRSGNRVSQTVDGATLNYTYDANDRLLTESDGTSHVYDNNGNLVRTEKGSATQRYSWDSSGRLSEHTDAAGIRTAYSYDPERSEATAGSGIRVSRTSRLGEADAERTAYLIDYLQPYAQVLEEAAGPATSSVLTHQVAYVHGDDLIAQVRGGVAQHYHYDALGSTRLLSGASGAVSDRYAYTAYGELDAAGSSVVSENAYRYTGEQFDSALGMYYLRARYMDPGRGRFMGMDLWEGSASRPLSLNKYLYSEASPSNYTDPSGLTIYKGAVLTISNILTKSQLTNVAVNVFTSAASGPAGASGLAVGLLDDLVFMMVPGGGWVKNAHVLGNLFKGRKVYKLSFPPSGQVLAHNLKKFGRPFKSGDEAHHIVPGNDDRCPPRSQTTHLTALTDH